MHAIGQYTRACELVFGLLKSSILNDMFTHFEQLGYLDFYTLIKLSAILPHGVCKITRKF
jgi:hypothetical protein